MIAALRRLANRDAITAFALSAVATLLAVVVVLVMRGPAPLIVLDLKTELLEQRVARPELSTLALTAARFSASGDCATMLPDGLFDGTLKPPQGALLTYNWLPKAVRIDIVPPPSGDTFAPITLADRDENECDLQVENLQVTVTELDTDDPAWQLPVAGPARAGSEIGVPVAPKRGDRRSFDLLREGTIEVFGKSLSGGVLFPVQSAAFVVPAGSRIVSSDQFGVDGANQGASWYGTATYAPDGLHVSATTETAELRLYRPGAESQSEVFGVGLLASVLADPGLALLAFAFAVFATVTGLIGGWMGLWREPRPAAVEPAVVAAPPPQPTTPAPTAGPRQRKVAKQK